MIRDSSPCASLDRHYLLGIEPVVDPISPMLHQLRARADQRERSVLLVETFHSRVIEMRELQLDDVAIPCLGVLDLLVVRQGREGCPESVGTMISLGVNAKQPQALVERVVLIAARPSSRKTRTGDGQSASERCAGLRVPAVTKARHGPSRSSFSRLE